MTDLPTSLGDDLRADVHRLYGRSSLSLVVKAALARRTFRPILTLRLCQHVAGRRALAWLVIPVRLAHRATCRRAGIDLPWRTAVGPGLAINHGWGLVVSYRAVIGSNVTLFDGVTLGQRDRIARDGARETSYPVLGDDVWIGPNAVVVGPATIGRGGRIAANAFVDFDVPAGGLVAAPKATVISTTAPADVRNPAPVRPRSVSGPGQ